MFLSTAEPSPKQFWLFSAGISIVLLSLWFPFIPDWTTFIHSWRVELFASIFLSATLGFILLTSRSNDLRSIFSHEEKFFLIYPMIALILLSAVSACWAESWRSAFHHALVWSEYLVFYCLVRHLLDSEEQQRRFTFVLAGGLALYALPAIAGYISIQIFGGTNTLGVRFSRFGEQVIVLLPILIVVTVSQRNKFRWIGTASIASAWLLVLCSTSRTTMFLGIIVTAATSAGLLLIDRSRERMTAIAITVAVFVAAPLVLNSPSLFTENESAPLAQRLSDSKGMSESNGFRQLMIALSLEMIADKPLTGIGADNFGSQVHVYREKFAAQNPNSPLLTYAENELPERAHNEYLQIAAELGILGVAILGWLLLGIGVMTFRSLSRVQEFPVIAFAAITGVLAFLAAGLVTSYSFRLIQNGFFFFFALSIAAKYLLPTKESEKSFDKPLMSPRWAVAVGICASVMLSVYCLSRVGSVIYQERAGMTLDREEADRLYASATFLDPENPIAFKSNGMRAFRDQEFNKAVPLLLRSIEMGERTSTSFSYLASAQILSGDNVGAENTLRKAAEIYPRSVFVQARYSAILQTNGKNEEASRALEKAALLDPTAAATWLTLITQGAHRVSSMAIDPNSGIVNVMDLVPATAIYAVMSERLIQHPEEQKFSMFKPAN